jgi:cell division protein FtsN
MKAQTAQRGFPTALLTFSVMLLVLAIGFVVGRVVVAPAYLGAAPKIEAQGVGGSELDARRSAPGHVYVPSPSGSPPPDNAGEKGERASEGSARGQPAEAEQGEARLPVPEEPIQVPEGASPGEREQGRVGGAASARQGGARAQEPQPGEEKTSKTYSIQVGVFSSLQGARQVVDELARAGYPARISPDKRGAQTLYRVVTGRYQSEYAARKALGQLRTEGFDAFLIEQ